MSTSFATRAIAVPRPARIRRVGDALRGLVPLAVLLVGWQLLGDPESASFPPPSTWWTALQELNAAGLLLPAIGQTLTTFSLALGMSIVVGVAFGALIASSATVDRALGPFLEFCRTLPPPAIVPVAVLVLGTNLAMAVLVVVFAAIWPILLNTTSAVRAIPETRTAMARSLRLPLVPRVRKVMLPSITPGILLGIRLAVPLCFIVTLVVEMLTASGGAGLLLLQSQRLYDSPAVFGLLVVIGLLGLVLSAAINVIERLTLRNWPKNRAG